MRRILITILVTFSLFRLPAQPKLVVAIVVDQMRYNYFSRFGRQWGEGGFNRLAGEGYVMHNHYYNYSPTSTGPGHASIFTGTVPAIHGIADNTWYDRSVRKRLYCCEDTTTKLIGVTQYSQGRSPVRLKTTTIGDQLRLHNNLRSKVIGIALKDRGAILSAGYRANGAYWFDAPSGGFVSGSWYLPELPDWVKTFNAKKLPEKYLENTWKTLLPESFYPEPDDLPHETKFKGAAASVMPYDLKKLRKESGPDLITRVPWGNTYTVDFAIAAIEGEELGKDVIPDLLTVSFSSPDIVGHMFGPHSRELHDMYLRMDADIERLLKYLDTNIGKENVMVFLTSDHGVSDIPVITKANAGFFSEEKLSEKLKEFYKGKFNSNRLLLDLINMQVYLNADELQNLNVSRQVIFDDTRNFLLRQPGIMEVIEASDFSGCNLPDKICTLYRNGTNLINSGDFIIVTDPGWLEDATEHAGSSHGSPFPYDTHVPLVFWGWDVKPGNSYSRSEVSDIAPTLSYILQCIEPSGSTGEPIRSILESLEK